ncbi:MAG: 4-hydroxythreonine-4-phosphate dehydrogenase PdxA [Pirellulales bacterium]|nr:4-hydroxythreonine-4-phosphate dehydrogenase PdxA [Pirellulales bacterium]
MRIGIVMGDGAGIGPEIVLKALSQWGDDGRVDFTVFGSPPPLNEMARRLAAPMPLLIDCDVHKNAPLQWKTATAVNGANTLAALRTAVEHAQTGRLDGVVIGPLSKEALHLGGMQEPDEGTLLRNLAGVPWVRLVVHWKNLFRTSVVGHVPFREILPTMTTEKITQAVGVLGKTMRRFGVEQSRIGVAGINPHAGDGGAFGDDEARVIAPAIAKARSEGWDVTGPHPADTLFVKALRGDFAGMVFMHHDQGNAPMKALAFGEGVVLYRGLPFPCATVGHGPAYGRAGEGRASAENLLLTLRTTVHWVNNEKHPPLS